MDRSPVVHFGPFAFDRVRMVLRRNGEPIPIGGRGAAIMAALVEANGQVVTRAELLDAGWPGLTVEERNLTVQSAGVRPAWAWRPEGADPIRTVSRVGYRFLCDGLRPYAGTVLALRPSVVVLPFANLTADPELAFFADGMTEDVIAALSRFRTFAVVARGTSFAYRAYGASAAEAATALGVRYVLDGSVRREGRRLRVGARLTDAAGTVIWADRFEDQLGGVFEMQDRITAAVVALAEPRITCAEIDRSRRKHPENLDAYDHFVLGSACFDHLGTSAAPYHRMVHHLDRAAELDTSFSQALACAGFAHVHRRSLGAATPPGMDDFAIAVDLCDRALAQAPDDALVLAIAAMGFHNLRDDGEAGLALAERALALNPHSGPVLSIAATIQRQRHRADSAIALYERRLRLSPNSPYEAMGLENIGCCHLDAGRYAEAVDWLRRALALDASWDLALVNLIVAHAMLGQLTEAHTALRRFLAVRPGATIHGLMDHMAPGTRQSVEHVWLKGLRLVGLPER